MKSSKRLKADTVTDEQGRRRFHGAWTGGFSAGYYNTVGSEEGFQPQTFRSGRNIEKRKVQQSVLDFADEEDGLLGSTLKMKEDYSRVGGEEERGGKGQVDWLKGDDAHSLISGPILSDLIVATDRTIGIKLLQRMGWREGRGVGARIPMNDVPEGVNKSILPFGALEDSTGTITHAPSDFNIVIPPSKTDTRGLGFIGSTKSESRKGKASAYHVSDLFRGQHESGGKSAYEEDEDDAVFAEASSLYATEVVDEEDGEEDARLALKKSVASWVAGGVKGNESTAQKCPSDGRPSLEGFVLSMSPTGVQSEYPPIVAPASYAPSQFLLPASLSANKEVKKPKVSRWEAVAPPASDSVFALLSEDSRNHIKSVIHHAPLPIKQEPQAAPCTATEVPPTRPDLISEKSKGRFSGLSEAFKNRFVTASSSSSTTVLNDGVNVGLTTAAEFASRADPSLSRVAAEKLPKREFETLKIGDTRRSTSLWYPSHLLCKRFNVPVPSHSSLTVSKTANSGAVNMTKGRGEELFDIHIGSFVPLKETQSSAPALTSDSFQLTKQPTSMTQSGDLKASPVDLLVDVAMTAAVRPSLSMLKSIFDSDSESEGDSSDSEEERELTEDVDKEEMKDDALHSTDTNLTIAAVEPHISLPVASVAHIRQKYLAESTIEEQDGGSASDKVDDRKKIVFKKPNGRIRRAGEETSTPFNPPVNRTAVAKKLPRALLSFSLDDE